MVLKLSLRLSLGGIRNSTISIQPIGRSVLALFVVILASGCSTEPPVNLPATFPVVGKVLFADGQPLPGGAVQFQSTTDTKTTALGEIAADGSFTLTLYEEGQKLPGTIVGPHRVTVIPPMDDSQTAVPLELPEPFTVEPRENEFTITLGSHR